MSIRNARAAAIVAAFTFAAGSATASSHMDAPLITLDDAANTTDVYAFVSEREGTRYLTTALALYPFEEPGIGPNKYNFDDAVLYEIHIATGSGLTTGKPSVSYQFQFETRFKNPRTILQSYLGVVQDVDDANQNLTQFYSVRRVDARGRSQLLGSGVVPPNNQGIATPFYNRGDDGEQPAKDGVASAAALDRYTSQAVARLANGHRAFAGQRDDGFYADVQSVFDLLQLRSGDDRFDSQGGFNVHTISLEIPISTLGGESQVVGVWATTSRRRTTVLRSASNQGKGGFVQVARQGNPLFCEGLVALADKDRYNRTTPATDSALFAKYAASPELASLINAIVFGGQKVALETGRSDLVGIFIPDLIKVDLSTGPARLAGGGAGHPTNPDDAGFSRLGIFGGDVLTSRVQPGFGNGTVPGGWPNGRRFGDDVLDIAVSAILSDLRNPASPVIQVADGIDNVSANDIAYNKVFPYAATPLNGRRHGHH
jgi:Domain of unknown function (DUF4331)